MNVPMLEGLAGMNNAQMNQFGQQMKDAMKATTVDKGTETVAGKTCKVTETTADMMGMKQTSTEWRWENIIMRLRSKGMGTEILEEVTSIEVGVSIPRDKFEPPAGAIIKDVKSRY